MTVVMATLSSGSGSFYRDRLHEPVHKALVKAWGLCGPQQRNKPHSAMAVVLKAHLNVRCTSGLSIYWLLRPTKQMPAVLASAKGIGHLAGLGSFKAQKADA